MSTHPLWQNILDKIEADISHSVFEAWFKKTELVEQDEDGVTIAVSNSFALAQFQKKYGGIVKEKLEESGINAKNIQYIVGKSTNKKAIVSRETTISHPGPVVDSSAANLSTPLNSYKTKNGINKKYTFDNFIVGSSNDLAYNACQAIANNPGIKYNPLFLYGGVGLGKTHLMQAVGNEVNKLNPSATVLYVTTETFIKDFLDTVRFKKKGFADRYRNVDVLIVDDIQFIAGKEKTQEEFFHTFNDLHQANKQIIISSDKPPKNIPTLTERLRSRFEMGMTIDIQMPDFETRCAIIETKAALSNVELGRETVEYLATNIKTNIRELEGVLNQLLAHAEIRNVEPDVTTAEGLLGGLRHTRPKRLSARQIVEKTARFFEILPNEIKGPKRDKHIVLPRQIAMYLLRSELHLSFPQIAVELGRKDHTTAMHSIDKIEKAIKLDFAIRENVAEIKDRLYA